MILVPLGPVGVEESAHMRWDNTVVADNQKGIFCVDTLCIFVSTGLHRLRVTERRTGITWTMTQLFF